MEIMAGGSCALLASPGQDPMNILPFAPVSYDKKDNTMKPKDASRADDFIDISGTKMETLAKNGATPCQCLAAAGCGEGKLRASRLYGTLTGCDIVSKYYQTWIQNCWVPYSVMTMAPR